MSVRDHRMGFTGTEEASSAAGVASPIQRPETKPEVSDELPPPSPVEEEEAFQICVRCNQTANRSSNKANTITHPANMKVIKHTSMQ